MKRAGAGALVVLLAAGSAAPAAAQALITQPQRYLLTTDAFDGRALWLQPAGMARRREASLGWSVTGEQRGSGLSLAQYGLTLASGGFGLGWQRAELVDGSYVSQYAVGYGAGSPRASVGVTRRWLSGERVKGAVWDAGGRIVPRPFLEVSVVYRDRGSVLLVAPDTAPGGPYDTLYTPTLIPAAAITLFGGRARVGAETELLTDGWKRQAARVGAAVVLPFGLGLHVRTAFDGDFTFQDLSVALTWSGTAARVTGFGAFPQDGGARSYGLWGSAVRNLEQPRRPGWR